MENLFKGIFENTSIANITVPQFIISIVVALMIGAFLAAVYAFRSRFTVSFVVTLATLPAIVAVIIMMVSGNLGTGVAVAGTFSLVRFRSIPGSAKDIGMIFLAMGTGLIVGMGYPGFAVLFAVLLGLATVIFHAVTVSIKKTPTLEKSLRITIPEDLNYGDAFDDLFEKYTTTWEIVSVKTTNMGSMFKLNYNITLKDISLEKEFIDALRCRNGNLEIGIAQQEVNMNEL